MIDSVSNVPYYRNRATDECGTTRAATTKKKKPSRPAAANRHLVIFGVNASSTESRTLFGAISSTAHGGAHGS